MLRRYAADAGIDFVKISVAGASFFFAGFAVAKSDAFKRQHDPRKFSA